MRKIHFSKLASILATLMLLSMLVPVLAAAADHIYFGNSSGRQHTADNSGISFTNGGKVSGYLFSDELLEGVTDHVYLGAHLNPDEDNPFDSVVKAVYQDLYETVTGDVYYRYHFEFSVTDSTYEEIYLTYGPNTPYDAVSDVVYRDKPTSSSRPGGGGFFIPGISTPGTVDLGSRTEISESALRSAFRASDHVTVVTTGDFVVLPGNVLAEVATDNADAKITIATPNGTYTLPLSVFDFEALASELGNNLKIRVQVKAVDEDTADEIAQAIEAIGASQVSGAVDFAVTAEGNGKTISVNSFGNTYVERTIPLNESVDADKSTAVVYESGDFSFIPSVFEEEDGDAYVTLKRNSNSIYTVISQDKSFGDVPAGHWAEEDIHTLANKLVVHGVSDDQFDLNRDITRAEFAALVVRSLGLGGTDGSHSFSDVPANAWYADEIAIATVTGIVYGYEDGTFRPNNVITREELASLVIRAVDYAGANEELSASEQASLLAPFQDADLVADWGREELARAIQAEIVHGMSADTLDPKGNATRAQAVAMLYRYLQSVDFID